MKKSVISILTICLLIVGLMTGCGSSTKVTAESLLNDVVKNTQSMKSMESYTTVEASMETQGISMDMTMEVTMKSMLDPAANYMSGSISLMGMTLDMENYTILEGDDIVTYTGMMGEWMTTRMPYDKTSMNELKTADDDLLKNLDSLTLDEETEDVNGTEAYIISGTVKGEDIANLLGDMDSMVGDLTGESGMDLEQLSVDFKYAIDKNKKLPLYMDMTFNGFNVDDGETQVTMSKFMMKIEYMGFGTVDKIEVPQDIIDSAVDVTGQM